jgi:hypothetical protein
MRDQKKWFLYQKGVNFNVKSPNAYQLHPKRIIVGLILIKQESYLQLSWKLVQVTVHIFLLSKIVGIQIKIGM